MNTSRLASLLILASVGFGANSDLRAALVGAASSNPVVLVRESCGVPGNALVAAGTSGGNGAVDPGEFVEMRFAFTNQSSTPLVSLSIFVLNTNGVTGSFGARFIAGPVAPGDRFEADLSFLPIGSPGDVVKPSVQVVVGAVGTEILPFEIRLGKDVTTTSSFANATAILVPSIGQGSVFPSTVTVPPTFAGTVSGVKVRLFGVAHSRPHDLQALLVSPLGDKIILMNGVGGDVSASGVALTFDAGATASIAAAGPLVSGSYRPSAAPSALPLLAPAPGPPYSQDLTTLHGKSAPGTWSLFVSDSITVDGGSVTGGWALELTTSELQSCVSPVTPVLGGVPASPVTMNEDTVLNLSLNLSDDTTAAADLILSVKHSNTNLFADEGVRLGGSGATRSLTLSPRTNQFGTGPVGGANITIKLQDKDGFFVERTFRVDVAPVNDAPSLSAVPNLPIAMDGVSDEITLTLSDVETEVANLLLFATSSNPAVVPDGRVQFTGTGSQRKMVVRPLPGQSGFSTITLALLDPDGGVASVNFLVVVSSPNAFPVISDTGNQSLVQNQSVRLDFTVSDRETPASDLLVTVTSTDSVLVPPSGLVLGGAGSSRSLTITPARGLSGRATVTIRVRDSSAQESTDSFELLVSPTAPPPNLPPRLGPISEKFSGSGQALVFRLNVQDADHDLALLKFSATSDFTSLLPSSAITFEFVDGGWLLRAQPMPQASGTVTVVVKAEDPAGGISTASFRATFQGFNTPPELTSFPELRLEAGKTSAPIVFYVADQESPFDELQVAGVVSQPALAFLEFQGTGFERRLVVKAAGGGGGSTEVRVTVTDPGGQSASTLFKLNISPEPVVIPPILTFRLNGDRFELSWPSTSTGFVLESALDLVNPNWQNLGTGGIPIGGMHRVSVTLDPARQFFRLRRP
ncbi:MAG: hypothetical protein FJ404_16690 [Verrucomicrobia bacterium]|nr:hypothetical protein [Verrucomicrobiota bacterium]